MTLLCRLNNQWEVDGLMAQLSDSGIQGEVVSKAREYTNIITGMGNGSFVIYVRPEDFLRAKNLNPATEIDPPHKNYFKRVVFFSFLATIFFPLVFNVVATINYRMLQRDPTISPLKKWLGLFVLLGGWVLSFMLLSQWIGMIGK